MSDLTDLRDHARFMASREHAAGCPPVKSSPDRMYRYALNSKWCGQDTAHDEHEWTDASRFGGGNEITLNCPGLCGGCMTDSERALWQQIADEIDVYLEQPAADEGLFDD